MGLSHLGQLVFQTSGQHWQIWLSQTCGWLSEHGGYQIWGKVGYPIKNGVIGYLIWMRLVIPKMGLSHGG